MRFYTLRVASNKEDSVAAKIKRKVEIEGLQNLVGRIYVPTERVPNFRQGKAAAVSRKLYPGYVFIELEPNPDGKIPEQVWFLIRETDGVGDFINSDGKPTPMTPKDEAKIIEAAEKVEDTSDEANFKKGEPIRVTNGPFENFEGEVDEVLADKRRVRIVATIFGRPTPLELEYWQVERIEE